MSQFRKDIVSGEWTIVAPGRRERPDTSRAKDRPRCPFDDLKKSGNWPPILKAPAKGRWSVVVIPNKYPIVAGEVKSHPQEHAGPYIVHEGVGEAEVVILRDHTRTLDRLPRDDVRLLFRVFRDRCRVLSHRASVQYVSLFLNQGVATGASAAHPHCQLVGLPLVPSDVERSLLHAREYFRTHKKCIHCTILRHERRVKTRIIFENRNAIVIVPFASRYPYELRVYPKRHYPLFEHTPVPIINDVADLLGASLAALAKRLHKPDVNFFIHSAPLSHPEHHRSYHWHIEIIPKTTIPGGFELSTGLGVNVVDPDEAATALRGHRVPQ